MARINSQRKGSRGELELAKMFREHLGLEARRAQQYSGVAGDADVLTSCRELFIESKAVEALNLFNTMDKAKEQAGAKIPLVAWKRNRRGWILCVPIERAREFCLEIAACQPPKECKT